MAQDAPLTYETALDAARLVRRAFELEADDALLEAARAFSAAPPQGLEAEAQKLVDRGAKQLAEALKKYDEADDKALWRDYLDASYAELFLGVALQSIAPQESVYCGPDKLMYEKQYFQVRETMQEWGFSKPSEFAEPEDHIACEWMFLLFLLDTANDARAKGDGEAAAKASAAAHTFKELHMDTWTEKSYKDMVDADDAGFYTGIVNVARGVQKAL